MMRAAIVLCALTVGAGLLWQFPLIHIVRLDEPTTGDGEPEFNAANFAETFWTEQLLPAAEKAPDASAVLAAIRETPKAAREQFGRKVGVSRTRFFVVRGTGTIVSVDKKGVGVALDQNKSEPDIVFHTGLLFGNTARDATGLLDAGDFRHSQDFNEISTALNRIIEERVISQLKNHSDVGRRIQFAGSAEVPDDASPSKPLVIVPFQASVE